jgi:hypothetical protein
MNFETAGLTSEKKEAPKNFSSAYELAGVDTPDALGELFHAEDQKLMEELAWDPDNQDLLMNRLKDAVERADPESLNDREKEVRHEILWLWNHHAIGTAVWKKRNRAEALRLTEAALANQPETNRNKITKLFHLLINDDAEGAERWADGCEGIEQETARQIIDNWKNVRFEK